MNPLDRPVRVLTAMLECLRAIMPEQLVRAACDRDYDAAVNRLDDPDDGGQALEPRIADDLARFLSNLAFTEPPWQLKDRISTILRDHEPGNGLHHGRILCRHKGNAIDDFPDYQGWCDHVAGVIARQLSDKVSQ